MSGVDGNQITAEIITELAKSTVQGLVTKAKKHLKDISNKEKIDFGNAYETYLRITRDSISMAKTILYGHEPHNLYTFFECIGVKYNDSVVDTSDVNHLLALGHKLIITGTGGIGKSILLKHLFLNTIHNGGYIPIMVELRGLNDYNPDQIIIKDYIYHILCVYNFKLEREYFDYSLESGCYVILFDGFDEVKNTISQKVTREITELSNQYPDNYYILSSRPLREFVGWSDFIELTSIPLTKQQALSLVSKLDYDQDIKEKFCSQLDDFLYDKYQSFASNPLLLTIMLLTFESRISFPDKRNDFYDQAFSTLYHKHDAMKGTYKRIILSNLGYEEFKLVFSYICFKTFFKSQFEFTESSILEYIEMSKRKGLVSQKFSSLDYLKDLTNAVCMLVHDGLNFRFAHRSFQEYFAALYAVQLSDDEQVKFFTAWLKESSKRMTTDFLEMLNELQPTRFIRNVLYPGLAEFHRLYAMNEYSKDWLLSFLYGGVSVYGREEDQTSTLYIHIKNSYYHEIYSDTLRVIHYDYSSDNCPDTSDRVIDCLSEQYEYDDLSAGISFERLKEDGNYEMVKEGVSWVFVRIDRVFDFYKSLEDNAVLKKNRFESMLEEM